MASKKVRKTNINNSENLTQNKKNTKNKTRKNNQFSLNVTKSARILKKLEKLGQNKPNQHKTFYSLQSSKNLINLLKTQNNEDWGTYNVSGCT